MIAGWSLMAVPSAALAPTRIGSSSQRQPMAKSRNRIGPTWPSLTAYANGHDSPASRTIHQRTVRETGRMAVPDREGDDQAGGPGVDGGRRRQQPERQDERGEGRRVVEQAEPTGRRVAHVVQRLAVQQADGRLVIGEEVEAERVGRDRSPDRQTDDGHEHEDGDDRERRPAETAQRRCVHHVRCAPLRPLPRWMSGIRKRSQATRMASPGRARIRDPRRSYQRMGTIASR